MKKKASHFLGLLVGVASLALDARGIAATAPAVQVSTGPVTGEEHDGVLSFKGIPFAAPPVGELRWKPPQPPQPWTEPRACVQFGPACPQQGKDLYGPVGETNEDCLYLNVWTPVPKTGADTGRRPVMFTQRFDMPPGYRGYGGGWHAVRAKMQSVGVFNTKTKTLLAAGNIPPPNPKER